MSRTLLQWIGSATLVLALVGTSHAASVTTTLTGYKGGVIQTTFGNVTVQGGAGALQWQVQSDADGQLVYGPDSTFITFCIEAAESIQLNHTYDYAVVDPALAPNDGWPQMGEQRAGLLTGWFAAYYQGDSLSDWTNTQAMAFQMGVWEIVAETTDAFDLVSGFHTIGNQAVARDLAQAWLDDEAAWQGGNTPHSFVLKAMTSPWPDVAGNNIQDQVFFVVATAPAPSAVFGGLGLLGTLSVVRWRRRRQADLA
ncbi:MAG: hypothetical protein WD009_03905 [Phycisphaeraceae bacterium]